MQRTFDWKLKKDPRSLAYGIMRVTTPVPLKNKSWKTPPPLDQGQEGACVGFGWTGELLTTPVAVVLSQIANNTITLPNSFARAVYKRAQMLDEWTGEDYEGTSVLAGAKVMVEKGLLKEYRWCFSVPEIVQALLTSGPVVLGINWYAGMYEAPSGILSVSGELVGGHCILARAYAIKGKVFEDEAAIGLLNSWGPDWGDNGLAWIRESDLAKLMAAGGEACVPFRRSYGR